jgi:radical SAM superfamily enzyme YgiQ (UPF0313 family)
MKVLLVRPRPHPETIGLQDVMICEPLELEYLGAALKAAGHEVVIVDMILERKPLEFFVREHRPDYVGLTAYIAHINIVKESAARVKQVAPSCRVVVGGVHAEVIPEDFVSPHIDFIVRANGIRTMLELVEGNSEAEGVWREKGPFCAKETTFQYPHPDRSLVERYRSRYYYMFHNPCALMKTSYGCPYQCKFCFCRNITDGQYFVRDIPDVIAELKSIPEREVYIVDDDFLVARKRVLAFCDELKANNLDKRFLVYARADFVAGNEDVIRRFAECGLRAVIVGLESGSEAELKEYNKQGSVKSNEEAVAVLTRNGVECYGTFILGVDWSPADFRHLLAWIRKLGLKFVNLQPFTPLPGTELYDSYRDRLIISRSEAEKWDLAHLSVAPGRMSIRAYYWNIIVLYYKITLRPASVLQMIRQYGLRENIKLSLGASKITWQYFKKMVRG